MIKILFSIFFIFFSFNLFAAQKNTQIYWYLASSMTKPGKEIVDKFNKNSKDIKVNLITGGSGQLLSKILLSKKADIYTPASVSFMKKAEKDNVVEKSFLMLKQTPVFAISPKTNKKINRFEDLYNKEIRIAFGKENTMALGKLYKNIENKMDKNTQKKLRDNMVVKAINISQIVNYLKTNTVDAGILFDSTAKANNLKYIEIPKKFKVEAKVNTLLLNTSKNKQASEDFIKFIFENKRIFEKYGFNFIGKL
jgi:molybdate transport system substrate-binding protein